MTVTRRQFLTGTAAIAAGQLATGCAALPFWQPPHFKVQILDGTIPVQLLSRFRSQVKGQGKLKFVPVTTPKEIFTILQYWQRGLNAYQRGLIKLPFRAGKEPVDLISLGDAWLTGAIRQQLIQPLDANAWSAWSELPSQFQQIVQRDAQGFPTAEGQTWGAPYRWGSTVIAYRKNRLKPLGFKIQDWSDLWNPALKGQISLLNDPREVLGLALKQLGGSYNTEKLAGVAGLKAKLGALHQQVKVYSSDNYLQPLMLEDTWVAVGWSGDLLPLLQRDRNLVLVYPRSGTALWADLWVQPRSAKPLSMSANDWINFCWQPEIAELLSRFTDAVSPRALTGTVAAAWTQTIQHREVLLPDGEALSRSEFIQPLPQESLDEYQALWLAMRKGELI